MSNSSIILGNFYYHIYLNEWMLPWGLLNYDSSANPATINQGGKAFVFIYIYAFISNFKLICSYRNLRIVLTYENYNLFVLMCS